MFHQIKRRANWEYLRRNSVKSFSLKDWMMTCGCLCGLRTKAVNHHRVSVCGKDTNLLWELLCIFIEVLEIWWLKKKSLWEKLT